MMLQAQEPASASAPATPSPPYVSAWNSDMRHWQHQQAQAQVQAQSRNHVMVPVPVPVPVPGMMPGMVPVPVPVAGMFPGYGYAPYPYTPVGVGVPPVTPSQYQIPMLFDQQHQQQAQAQALNMQFMHHQHQHQAAQQPTLTQSEPVPVPVHVPHTRATATSAVRPSPTPTFQQATARVVSAQRAGSAPLQAPPTPSHQVGHKRKLVELTGAPGTSSLSPTGTSTSLSPPSLISPRLVSPVSAKATAANAAAAAAAVAAAQRTRLGATDPPAPISRLSRNVLTPIALPASLTTPIAMESDPAEPPTPTSTTTSGRARSPPSPVDASRLRHRASDSARRAKHSAAFQQLVAFATRYAHGKTDKATVLSTTAKLMQTFEERVSELTAALEEARERNATLAAERADLELDSAVEQAVKQAQQQAGSGSSSSSSSSNSSTCSSSTCSPRSDTLKSSLSSTPSSQSSSLNTACEEDALPNPSAVIQWSKPASLPHRQQARLVRALRQKHIASTDSTASSPSSSTRSVDLSVDCSNSNSNSDEILSSILDSSAHQYMFLSAGVGMWCISITGELRDINNHALSRVGATRDFILHRQVMAEAAFLPKLLQQTPSEQQLACTQQHMYSGGAHYATGTGCVGPLNPYPETLTAYWQLLHKQKRVVRVRRRNFISSGHFYEGMSSVWLVTDPDTDEPKYLVGAWADADVMHLIDLRSSEGVSRATSLIENTGVSFSDMDKWMEQQQQIDIQHHARQHQLHHHHDKHSLDHSHTHSHPSSKAGLASLDGGSSSGSRSSLTAATMPLADIDDNSNSDSSNSDSDSDEMDHQHPPCAPIDLRRLHIDLDADSHSHEDNDHDHDLSDDEQHTRSHSHQHMHHIKHLHSHVHERPNKVHVVG